jgi:hypothetical protein
MAQGTGDLGVPDSGGQLEGFLVALVPASSDTLHVVEDRDRMSSPYRDSAHTLWMSEYQVETAYRARFARQAGSVAALDRQIEDRSSISQGIPVPG